MRVVRWPGGETPCARPSVATLGVFDGVHLGHVAVIGTVCAEADAQSLRSAVITLDRHPGAVAREAPQPVITSIEHKLKLFESLRVALCIVVRFDREVAATPAESFARRVFAELLGARLLVLGEDCRFGRNQEGDVDMCRRLGPDLGFEVRVVAPVAVDGERVSSTAIREAVLKGEFARAQKLLGRPFSLYGTVVRGDGRGARLGYPTANLDPHNETIPPDGVYAARALVGGRLLPAVVSVGRRETFRGRTGGGRVVEVHLIGSQQDLYDRSIEVQFVSRLRSQQAFEREEDLVAQVGRDVEAALAALRETECP